MSVSLLQGGEDTIAAISTATGRSAIAIVRLSGAAAHDVAARVVRPFPGEARRATLASAVAADGERLDEVLVVRFDAPASYTGENLVEIGCHGGAAAPPAVLAALVAAGARPAEPGEFTRRAVLNGQLDLLQAEAVGDIIDAQSQRARRAAIDQLDGGLSRRVLALRDVLLTVEALIAYDIDFPEEDDGPVSRDRVRHAADDAVAHLDALLATARAGELVRDGALVVIAGAPNAGKSSLFNALLGRRRAIVTSVPGTTRDALEAVLDAGRWPLRLVDTAGLRETDDLIEQLGVEVSAEYLAEADVVLACGESPRAIAHVVGVVTAMTNGIVIPVRTKDDVETPETTRGGGRTAGWARGGAAAATAIATSAESGTGLADLVAAIEESLDSVSGGISPETPLLTHVRHRQALERAHDEVVAFRDGWEGGALPAPVAAVHLREAVHVLEELVGAVDVEDVLSKVFSTFCVGK